jgi:hypothetical protein
MIDDQTTLKTKMVTLEEGQNTPVLITDTDELGNPGEVNTSFMLDTIAPALIVTNNQTVTASPATISGTVSDASSGVQTVTCNGTAVTVTGGSFSMQFNLASGSNTFNFIATDNAGNTSSALMTVQYSPPANTTTPSSSSTAGGYTSGSGYQTVIISPTTTTATTDNTQTTQPSYRPTTQQATSTTYQRQATLLDKPTPNNNYRDSQNYPSYPQDNDTQRQTTINDTPIINPITNTKNIITQPSSIITPTTSSTNTTTPKEAEDAMGAMWQTTSDIQVPEPQISIVEMYHSLFLRKYYVQFDGIETSLELLSPKKLPFGVSFDKDKSMICAIRILPWLKESINLTFGAKTSDGKKIKGSLKLLIE